MHFISNTGFDHNSQMSTHENYSLNKSCTRSQTNQKRNSGGETYPTNSKHMRPIRKCNMTIITVETIPIR